MPGIDGIQLTDGIQEAARLIDSGAAYDKLGQFIRATQEVSA